jgi:DNA polymerase-3 subunit chi
MGREMTRIDFYLIEGATHSDHRKVACLLTEKAFARGHRVFLHLPDPEAARQMDEILWTFRDGSFVPHAPASQPAAEDCPVVLSHEGEPPAGFDILLNLGDEVPAFFSRFERVLEVVPQDEAAKARARERFRFYKDRGYPLETHRL